MEMHIYETKEHPTQKGKLLAIHPKPPSWRCLTDTEKAFCAIGGSHWRGHQQPDSVAYSLSKAQARDLDALLRAGWNSDAYPYQDVIEPEDRLFWHPEHGEDFTRKDALALILPPARCKKTDEMDFDAPIVEISEPIEGIEENPEFAKVMTAYNKASDERRALHKERDDLEGRLQRERAKRRKLLAKAKRMAEVSHDRFRHIVELSGERSDNAEKHAAALKEASDQRLRADRAEIALQQIKDRLADPNMPERESDLLILKRQRDQARDERAQARQLLQTMREDRDRLRSLARRNADSMESLIGRLAKAENELRRVTGESETEIRLEPPIAA